jgi:hypothetical protein
MNTFTKYAAALLSFLILVLGATQTVLKHPTDLTVLIPFGIVVLGAIATFFVPLIQNTIWQGRIKTGIAILTTILATLVPFLLPGGFVPGTSWPVVFVAIFNALATELGIQIRIDASKPAIR